MPAQTSNPTSQLPAPRSFEGVSDRLAVARAADERWRGDRTKEGGNWRPPHLFLIHLKAANCLSVSVS